MKSIEIPVGKEKSRFYRFFEIFPGAVSYLILLAPIALSIIDPFIAGVYVLLVIFSMLIKALNIARHTIRGYRRMTAADKVDWHQRFMDLHNPAEAMDRIKENPTGLFREGVHLKYLKEILDADGKGPYLDPKSVEHVVIVAAYNEAIEVIEPTIQSLIDTTINKDNLTIVFAYEERGGEAIKKTVDTLESRYGDKFKEFHKVMHPKDLPGEVIGKGGNITYAGKYIGKVLQDRGEDTDRYIITTLDCDNRPHPAYFDYVSYEYVMRPNRQKLAYQPISLFLNNIWDVPAPMRVVATGNSFWNIISSSRADKLRNFASHSQPLTALIEMDFWSTRTIVEDGHQYWRSYFHFDGDYDVLPVYTPIYQDAVLGETYLKTLKAQFIQLRRWSYGASDVPYVADRIFGKNRNVPFVDGFVKFNDLLVGHVTNATIAIIIAVGGWIPLLINPDAAQSVSAHQLPNVVSGVQTIAMIGLMITIFVSFKMLPRRPARYKRHRNIFMLLQWVLMPVTAIGYNALSALNAQTRLMFGLYLDKFDVTEKYTATQVSKSRSSGDKKKWYQRKRK